MSHRVVVIFFVVLMAPAVFALNNRSAVSVNGNDANPCTPASPCRSFGAAIAQTNPGGEIIALDSAGYGPFSLSVPLTISGAPGVHAAITATSGIAIQVAALGANDRVILRNLVLIGSGGSTAILEQNAQELTVIGCLIRGFTNNGILVNADAGNLSVEGTALLDNSNAIAINVAGASTQHLAIVTHCLIQGNNIGLHVNYSSDLVVSDSTISGNTTGAETISSTNTGLASTLTVERCTLVHNGDAIHAFATGTGNTATATLSQNVIALNDIGVDDNTGTVNTFSNNRFFHNFTADVNGLGLIPIAAQ